MAGAAAVGRAIRADLSNLLRDVMLNVTTALVQANPVDTGHSRSNWILSTRHPYMSIDGSPENVSTAEQDAGIAKIMQYDIGRDGSIYLRNNVHYVQYLDAGSSPQAQAGWVAAAFMSGVTSAPRGTKTRVRKLLRRMAKEAYRKGI